MAMVRVFTVYSFDGRAPWRERGPNLPRGPRRVTD